MKTQLGKMDKCLYVNYNFRGFFSILSNSRVIFPYKTDSSQLRKGFIKDVKIVDDKDTYSFYSAIYINLRKPTLDELAEYCKDNKKIILPIYESSIDNDNFMCVKVFDENIISYDIINIGIDDDNEIIEFRTNKFQVNKYISYSLIKYIENITSFDNTIIDLNKDIVRFIQFGNTTADYILYNNKILAIIDYTKFITKYVFKIGNSIINFEMKDLILDNISTGVDVSNIFNDFIKNNYITYNSKLSMINNKNKYHEYIKIDYNEKIYIDAFKLGDVYELYGNDFIISLIEYCKENNIKG